MRKKITNKQCHVHAYIIKQSWGGGGCKRSHQPGVKGDSGGLCPWGTAVSPTSGGAGGRVQGTPKGWETSKEPRGAMPRAGAGETRFVAITWAKALMAPSWGRGEGPLSMEEAGGRRPSVQGGDFQVGLAWRPTSVEGG